MNKTMKEEQLRSDEELSIIQARMDEAKRVMCLPLAEKLKTINEYYKNIGINISISESQIGDNNRKHMVLDSLYVAIHKPHLVGSL